MGNSCCSCTSGKADNQLLDLSQKVCYSNEMKSSAAAGLTNNIMKDSYLLGEQDLTLVKSASILLTRQCKGYLFRKHFNSEYQTILLQFQKEVYSLFEKKHTAYIPSNIWEYTPEQWSNYSVSNIINNKENSKTIFLDRIMLEYDSITSTVLSRYDKTPNELVDIALSGFKGTTDKNFNKIGFGTLIYNTGKVMRGFRDMNAFTGFNEIIESDGSIQIGEFSNSIMNGKGEQFNFFNKQDLYYKGDYVQGRREGQGVEIIRNCIYEGSFVNDMKTKGKATYESGDVYEGSFENNIYNGEGRYIWKRNGHEYIGGYKNGKYEGHGVYKWSDSEYYRGQYRNGIKEGMGELHMKNGIVFIGPFVNGVMHGVGDYKSANYSGKVEFVNGQLNKNYVPQKKNLFKHLYKKKEKEAKEAKEKKSREEESSNKEEERL